MSLSRLRIASLPLLAVWLAPPAEPQGTALSIDGSSLGFGQTLADLGDVDGDGTHDLVIGSPRDDTAGADVGAVFVHSGASGALLYALTGPANDVFFGGAVTVVGDLDGDGREDFVVRRKDAPSFADHGIVHVYSGASGQPLLVLDGAALLGDACSLGYSADRYGDFDLDGVPDLLLGAPTHGGIQGTGAVAIVSGATGALLKSIVGAANTLIGHSVAGLDDLDSDGVPDFAVSGFLGGGLRVWIHSAATSAVLNEVGYAPNGFLDVSSRGDFDGDGRDDLLVAQEGLSIAAYDTATMQLLGILTPPACESVPVCSPCVGFGFVSGFVGDFDGDGRDDVGEFDPRFARVSVLSAASGAVLFRLATPELFPPGQDNTDTRTFGRTHDWNGDGRPELLIGLPQTWIGGFLVGRAIVATDDHLPAQGVLAALGDGSGAPCPCGNLAQAGAGCANSSGQGATLRAFGSTSSTSNDLQLVSEHIPVGSLSALISGLAVQQGGLGTPFKDGLFAIAGSTKRVRFQSNCASTMTWGPGLANAAGFVAGQTHVWQVWYRDLQGPCGTGGNFANGLIVTITP